MGLIKVICTVVVCWVTLNALTVAAAIAWKMWEQHVRRSKPGEVHTWTESDEDTGVVNAIIVVAFLAVTVSSVVSSMCALWFVRRTVRLDVTAAEVEPLLGKHIV